MEPVGLEAQKLGGGPGDKCCRFLKCEPWWAQHPLIHCCICVTPLRKRRVVV